ncbi:hypothetical protein B6I21_01915 [candidate division KSB1 bacterium 4572_119]|nr:MAG: hypothetical protein B6I21_01915 [candidate division KSB1 bacterium 4572_119]
MTEVQSIPASDFHCDTPYEIFAGKKLTDTSCAVNLDALKKGNVGVQVFACYLSPNIPEKSRFELINNMINAFKRELKFYPDEIELCLSVHDIEKTLKKNKIAAVLAIENGMAIESDLNKLNYFYEAGVRLLTVIHSVSSDWAISSNDTDPAFDGLTPFGEQVITEMNRLGMIIDISHSHEKTVEKILDVSKAPVIASHSCASAICQTPRNLNDDQIKRISSQGGLIGVNFFPGFLDQKYSQLFTERCGDIFDTLDEIETEAGGYVKIVSQAYSDLANEVQEKMADIRVPAEKVVEHLKHFIKIGGIGCVGFGSDFDGVPDLPDNLKTCAGFSYLRNVLLKKGFSIDEIEKICYKNFLRVFENVSNLK